MSEVLKRTPLYEEHVALGAKIVPFAGYEMPVQYPEGITAEHRGVRTAAGLFDVSHMGEIEIRGPQALELVQFLTVNDASRLESGQAQYSALCREDGGVIDDLVVYRYPDRFMLVVNAANREKDVAWVKRHAARFDVNVADRSDDIALLALQGPRAQDILAELARVDLDRIRYYHFAEGAVNGRPATISRTGYTGEDGFELYVAADGAAALWRELLRVGGRSGLIATGLGARDSLRLEVGYALYGNDLDEEHTALASGLGWIVKLEKGEFVGRAALRRQKEEGATARLSGLRLLERGFPRHGYSVERSGESVGVVTSGTVSPTLGDGIALAYVATEAAAPGTEVDIVIRGRKVPAKTERPPFYRNGSIRK
ncbi:MAG: glycine cleavage system aminomethyltransferase GcvT [Gemmatimonadetes bacterium]|nr:glycine cleavage system aminomethyltransferase GcvT [Gemmatimonadota bacterium]